MKKIGGIFKPNMTLKRIQIDGVGEVVFEHSRKAKHINLSVKPFKGIRVAVPLRVSWRQAEAVARSKIAWLQKHQKRVAAIEKRALAYHSGNDIDPSMARNAIVKRLNELAVKHGFVPGKITIRRQKTRWGSCSIHNDISLNMCIVQLPPELMDYIILHELVHTRIRNHSLRFWKELGRLIENPKQVDRQLNQYGFMLAL